MNAGDSIFVPERCALNGGVGGNKVVQVAVAAAFCSLKDPLFDEEGRGIGFSCPVGTGLAAFIFDKPFKAAGYSAVLAPGVRIDPMGESQARWITPSPVGVKPKDDVRKDERPVDARASWHGRVVLVEEAEGKPGLRPPQVGGVYGCLSHWKSSDAVATVVMPTGTGKTETMLTLLVHERFERLLVLVPSDSLRDQIARKFETLGKLRELGVLKDGTLNPVVGRLTRKPKTQAEALDLFLRCNVLVSTVAALTGLPDEVNAAVADSFDGLFIDEAHHVAAATWTAVRSIFTGREHKRIVQFTATPFREDGKLVDGKVVFRFPMRRAMSQGYFRKIRFLPVEDGDEDRADEDIALKALGQLQDDLAAGFDHVLMARTKNKKRATEVLAIYRLLAPEYSPVCIHSGLTKTELQEAKAALFERRTRVIVCVDMLGEGFDFPNLKIAALHDPHRSLAVTLQFVGRFTRDSKLLGDATAVACLADPRMDDRIQSLYAEDADWNQLLDDLSEGETHSAIERSEFLAGFTGSDDELLSLKQIFPRMSTAIFRTNTTAWKPHRIEDGLGTRRTVRMGPRINEARRTVLVVTEESEEVPWGDTKVITNTMWHLFLAHWDENERLLFINTSDHGMSLKPLADALAGAEVDPVISEAVFKPFHGISRMTLLNVGLKSRAARFTRFSMLVGPDVAQSLNPVTLAGKSKTNVFVTGLLSGKPATLGASTKGRIWSYAKVRDMSEWVSWCQAVGRKIRDPLIDGATVLDGAMVPTAITERPAVMPLAVEWTTDILNRSEDAVFLDAGAGEVPILDASLEPVFNDVTDPLRFVLRLKDIVREFEVRFGTVEEGATFIQTGGSAVRIKTGTRALLLTEWFNLNPPSIIFVDLSELEGHFHFDTTKKVAFSPIAQDQLIPWSWPPPVDITKESHRRHPPTASAVAVQTHAFAKIDSPAWSSFSGFAYEVIFDDDGSGEAADIVALAVAGNDVRVDLFHCKFSVTANPGARVGDLYEVCGQSARSMHWVGNPAKLIDHLVRREKEALKGTAGTRIVKGDRSRLKRYTALVKQRRVVFRVFAVQPGLMKSRVATEPKVRDILASVDTYLRQSAELGLHVICSG